MVRAMLVVERILETSPGGAENHRPLPYGPLRPDVYRRSRIPSDSLPLFHRDQSRAGFSPSMISARLASFPAAHKLHRPAVCAAMPRRGERSGLFRNGIRDREGSGSSSPGQSSGGLNWRTRIAAVARKPHAEGRAHAELAFDFNRCPQKLGQPLHDIESETGTAPVGAA